MKFITLLALVLSTQSFAETTIKKTFDGGSAVCSQLSDVGQRAYRIEVASEKINGAKRDLEINVKFLECKETQAGIKLVASSSTAVTESYVLKSNNELGKTKNTLLKTDFVAFDKNDQLLAQATLVSGANSSIKLSVDKNADRIFLGATLTSKIVFPEGQVDASYPEHFGGFVLLVK